MIPYANKGMTVPICYVMWHGNSLLNKKCTHAVCNHGYVCARQLVMICCHECVCVIVQQISYRIARYFWRGRNLCDLVINGFKKAGIVNALKDTHITQCHAESVPAAEDEDPFGSDSDF